MTGPIPSFLKVVYIASYDLYYDYEFNKALSRRRKKQYLQAMSQRGQYHFGGIVN